MAFLCLDHHDEYDTTKRLSRSLTPVELTYYRDRLYEEIDSILGNSGTGDPTPIEILEERIAQYYHDECQYTSLKVYLTPSLDSSLYLADKRKLVEFCRRSAIVHMIHPRKGLGILPNKSMREFFEMERCLESYEVRKTLPGNRTDCSRSETVKQWIEAKTDEAYNLVCTHVLNYASDDDRELYAIPHNFGLLARFGQDLSSLFCVDRSLTRALIRFTFHVGTLYRCALKRIIVVCGSEDEYRWFRMLNNAVGKVGPLCDLLPELPHYDILLLPPLRVVCSTPCSREIILAITREI